MLYQAELCSLKKHTNKSNKGYFMNYFFKVIWFVLSVILALPTHAADGEEHKYAGQLLFTHIDSLEETSLGTISKYLDANPGLINQLIDDVKAPGIQMTPLTYAILYTRNKDFVAMLVNKHNADVNKPASDGRTPLMLAVDNQATRVALMLQEKGAFPVNLQFIKEEEILQETNEKILEQFIEDNFSEEQKQQLDAKKQQLEEEAKQELQQEAETTEATPPKIKEQDQSCSQKLEAHPPTKNQIQDQLLPPTAEDQALQKTAETTEATSRKTKEQDTQSCREEPEPHLPIKDQIQNQPLQTTTENQASQKTVEATETIPPETKEQDTQSCSKEPKSYPTTKDQDPSLQTTEESVKKKGLITEKFKVELEKLLKQKQAIGSKYPPIEQTTEKYDETAYRKPLTIETIKKQIENQPQAKRVLLLHEELLEYIEKKKNRQKLLKKLDDAVDNDTPDLAARLEKETNNLWFQTTNTPFMLQLTQQAHISNDKFLITFKQYIKMLWLIYDMLAEKTKDKEVNRWVKSFISELNKASPWFNACYEFEANGNNEMAIRTTESQFKKELQQDFLPKFSLLNNYLKDVDSYFDFPLNFKIIAHAVVWVGENISADKVMVVWLKKRGISEEQAESLYFKQDSVLFLKRYLTQLLRSIPPEYADDFVTFVKYLYREKIKLLENITVSQ